MRRPWIFRQMAASAGLGKLNSTIPPIKAAIRLFRSTALIEKKGINICGKENCEVISKNSTQVLISILTCITDHNQIGLT